MYLSLKVPKFESNRLKMLRPSFWKGDEPEKKRVKKQVEPPSGTIDFFQNLILINLLN